MTKSQIWLSYLSGNLPISLVYFISVLFDMIPVYAPTWIQSFWTLQPDNPLSPILLYIEITLSLIYLIITLYSTLKTHNDFKDKFMQLEQGINCSQYTIADIKTKTIFSSGTITYYILPLAAFAGSDNNIKGAVILLLFCIIFGIIYVRERLTAYTPILALLGYTMLSCKLQGLQKSAKPESTMLLIKSSEHFVYGGSYRIIALPVTESILIGKFKHAENI